MARYGSEVRPVNVFADFMAGKQAAQDDRVAKRQNAMADMQFERAQNVNALAQNPNATPEQYIRAGDAQTGAALQNSQSAAAQQKQQALMHFAEIAQRALQIPDPQQRRSFLMQAQQAFGPHLTALGGDPAKSAAELASLSDQELEQRMRQVAQFAPEKPKDPGFTLSEGQKRFDAGGNPIASVAPKPEKSGSQWRYLTPDEIKQRGLPDGTSAQIDTATGKVDVINKREGLSAAEQKTIREAKVRMPRLNAAVRRAQRLGNAVESLKGNMLFDGGPADARALQYTKQGQELNAASAQLMPELQALTRVPGIGSQSDLEARLASLALPSLEMSPEVNAKSQAELLSFIEDLKAAYASLISGDAASSKGQNDAADPLGIR